MPAHRIVAQETPLIRAPRTTPLLLASLLCLTAPLRAQHTPADTLLDDAHYLRAHALVQASLQKSPNDARSLVQQSVVEWAFFRFDAAIALAEKAVSLADNNAEAHTQLTNAVGAKLAAPAGGTFEKMGLARRFRKEAERSLQLDPNSLDAIEDSAQFYWNAPGFVGGDKTKARQFADRLTQVDPVRGAAMKATFAVEEKDKAKREATIESLWKAAVAARPDSYEAHTGLSSAYFDEGGSKLPLAEAEAHRAIALRPTRITAYRQLAVLYATTGRWDDLDKTLKQSHAAVPDNLSPDYHAARIILTSNATTQLTHAEQYLRAYLAQPPEGQEPSHAAAHWRLGLILEKQGRKSDAIQELQNAVRQDSSLEQAKKDLQRLS